YDAGRFAQAASDLGRADAIVPNVTALALALKAVVRTEDAALGMTLVDRAERRRDPGLVDATRAARERFERRAGTIHLACGERKCRAKIDGATLEGGEEKWVLAGEHTIEIAAEDKSGGERVESKNLRVAGGAHLEVSPSAQV